MEYDLNLQILSMKGTIMGLKEEVNKASDLFVELFRLELTQFMMYLASSDGEIHPNEAKLIEIITQYEFSPQYIEEFVKKNNIYSYEFEEKIPEAIKVAVAVENYARKNGLDPSKRRFVDKFYHLYKSVGNILLGVDGDIDTNEKADLNTYLNNIYEYVIKYSV